MTTPHPAPPGAHPRRGGVMSHRVPGHTLRNEGAPFVVSETGSVVRTWNSYGGIGGHGRGLCSCGEMSDLLDSAHQRKKWHREHKAYVADLTTHAEDTEATTKETDRG